MRLILIGAAFCGVMCLTTMANAKSPLPNAQQQTMLIPEDERDAGFLVRPGTRVELTLDETLRIASVRELPPPEPAPYAAVKGLDEESLTTLHMPFSAKKDTLLVTLWSDDKDGTRLQVENGYDQHLVYIASLLTGDVKDSKNLRLTTICSIAPGRVGYETWPERYDGILIGKWLEPPASDRTLCADPTRDADHPEFYTLD